MWQEFSRHRLAYILLLIGLGGFLALFLGLWPNRILLRGLSVLLGVVYVGWGVLTHWKTQTLNREVVAEYVGVASLAVAGLLMITI